MCYNFIEKISICITDISDIPSLYVIFVCWCIYTKNWFVSDNIEFHIVDHTGDECILTLNDTLIIKNNKIYSNKKFEQLKE